MERKEGELGGFLKEVQTKLKKDRFSKGNFEELSKTHLYQEQCVYVLNYIDQTVAFQKGVEEMLGYTPGYRR